MKGITIEFTRDYSPRKKGDVVSFTDREGLRTANWYLSNGIAVEACKCHEAKEKECSECEKLIEEGKRQAMTSETSFDQPQAKVTEIKLDGLSPAVVKPGKKRGKK